MQTHAENTESSLSENLETLLKTEFEQIVRGLGVQHIFRTPFGYRTVYVDVRGERVLPEEHRFTVSLDSPRAFAEDMIAMRDKFPSPMNVMQYKDPMIVPWKYGAGRNIENKRYLSFTAAFYQAEAVYQGQELIEL